MEIRNGLFSVNPCCSWRIGSPRIVKGRPRVMDIHWKGFCFFYKCPQNGDEILNFWMAMCIEALKLSDRNQTKATTLQNSVYIFAVRILLMAIGTMAIFFRYILHHIEQGRRCIWHQNFSRTNKPIWKCAYLGFFFFSDGDIVAKMYHCKITNGHLSQGKRSRPTRKKGKSTKKTLGRKRFV